MYSISLETLVQLSQIADKIQIHRHCTLASTLAPIRYSSLFLSLSLSLSLFLGLCLFPSFCSLLYKSFMGLVGRAKPKVSHHGTRLLPERAIAEITPK